MKIFTVGQIIISALVISSIVLTPSTALQASSKGLKIYLTVETNLNDDVTINTYQYRNRVYTHDGYDDGQDHPFDHDRNEECKDKGNQYYRAFIVRCKDA